MASSVFPVASDAINPTIVDAKGDLIAATAADAVSRLAVGANNTVLTADSTTATGLKWASPTVGVACFSLGVSFSYTNGTATIIPFASETFDTDGFHSTSTNTSRITIPTGKGGNYSITGNVFPGTSAGSYAIIAIFKNGTRFGGNGVPGQIIRDSPNGNTVHIGATVILPLVAGDYIEIGYEANSATGTYLLSAQFNAILLP
jgi:hypothetical protein